MKSKNLISLLAIAVSFCIISCGDMNKKPENSAAMEKNMETMKNVFNVFNTGNTEAIDNLVADNFVDHNPDPNIKTTGVQGLKDMIAMYRTSFPDLQQTITRMWAENDMVIVQFNLKGMNSGPMGSMPATNKSIDVDGVDIVRFENGKAVEHWGYYEESKMMQQMGLMPDMSSDASKMAMEEKMKMDEQKEMEKKK